MALALLLAFATGALAEAPGADPVITGEAIDPMVGEKDAVELVEQAADDARASSFAVDEAAIDLPEGLSVVAEEAFFGCGVRSVYLHDGVTDIGARAFANCAALCTIHIPETVTRIAEDTFDGCDTDMVIRGIAGSTAWQFAQAKGFPFEREDEGIAVLNLSIDPDEFLSVVDSPDHSYRAAGGTIRLLPSEGAETTLPLEYIRGRGNSTWRVDEKKPFKFLNW